MPGRGDYGANRNRLVLLAAYHAGTDLESSAFLHLDDDTPLLGLKGFELTPEGNVSSGKLEKNPVDVLTRFLEGLEACERAGKAGYAGVLLGVHDSAVSEPVISVFSARIPRHDGSLRLKPLLKKPRVFYAGCGLGPARMLSFKAFSHPYQPTGRNEDCVHGNAFGNYAHPTWSTVAEHAQVLHVGFKGAPGPDYSCASEMKPSLVVAWQGLVGRMASLRKRDLFFARLSGFVRGVRVKP